jgi:hypothetical protein
VEKKERKLIGINRYEEKIPVEKKERKSLTVIMAQHDTLWITGGATCVNQGGAVSSFLGGHSLLELSVQFIAFSKIHECLP